LAGRGHRGLSRPRRPYPLPSLGRRRRFELNRTGSPSPRPSGSLTPRAWRRLSLFPPGAAHRGLTDPGRATCRCTATWPARTTCYPHMEAGTTRRGKNCRRKQPPEGCGRAWNCPPALQWKVFRRAWLAGRLSMTPRPADRRQTDSPHTQSGAGPPYSAGVSTDSRMHCHATLFGSCAGCGAEPRTPEAAGRARHRPDQRQVDFDAAGLFLRRYALGASSR